MALRDLEGIQRLQGSVASAESCPSRIGRITLEVNQTGERTSGKAAQCVRRGGDWKCGMAEIL